MASVRTYQESSLLKQAQILGDPNPESISLSPGMCPRSGAKDGETCGSDFCQGPPFFLHNSP